MYYDYNGDGTYQPDEGLSNVPVWIDFDSNGIFNSAYSVQTDETGGFAFTAPFFAGNLLEGVCLL